jgi:DNA-binding NarL/FixJ family response regulator
MSMDKSEEVKAAEVIRVAIVEDNKKLRESLENILDSSSEINLLGAYDSVEVASRHILKLKPMVVIMDVDLPGLNGIIGVASLSPKIPDTQFLMLTVNDDTQTIFNAIEAGASGYLCKPVRSQELLEAIKDVNAGGAPLTGHIARKVLQAFKKPEKKKQIKTQSDVENLSANEKKVLDYLAQGYLYKEIADMMGIKYATVHTYVSRVYKKLHVRSRSQAVAMVYGHDGLGE